MKKTKLKIMSLVLAGVLSVGFVSYNGYFNNNIKVEATEGTEDTSWTVIDYNKLTDADLSAEDIAFMHEDNWLNQEVAKQRSKSVSDLNLSDFLNIKSLSKGNSKITNIPNSIKFLSNLTVLALVDNQLTSIPESIGNLTNLTYLYLYNNQLTSIPESIGNLTNLIELYLGNNRLTSIPKSFKNLTKLKSLGVEKNQLTLVPDFICNLTNLSYLSLANNQLTSIPETIGNLTKLTKLDLQFNYQLTSIPESIGNLTNLTYLYLSATQLTLIPESICNLTNLTNLELKNNRLTSLPESIGNLTNLRYLDLDDNALTSLPESIGNLTNLSTLRLGGDKLTSIPETIGNLTKLTDLSLRENKLTSIPESIGNLTNLSILRLLGNQLTSIPESIGNLTNLTYLNLMHNNLTSIPESIGNLTNLTYLNLAINLFVKFPNEILNLKNTVEIDLSSNLIEFIPQIPNNLNVNTEINLVIGSNSNAVPQLFYKELVHHGDICISFEEADLPTGLTCSSLNELNNVINNIDYFKNNIQIYNSSYTFTTLNHDILLKVIPVDSSFFDNEGNAIKTGDTYIYIKLKDISDENQYSYIRKKYKNYYNSKEITSDEYLKIPVHVVDRTPSINLKVGEIMPIEDILSEILTIQDCTEEINNTTIQSLDKNILSNEGKALSIGETQATLLTSNYGIITVDVNVTDSLKDSKTLNVKFTQPNTMSLTIDTNEIDFGEVNGLTDSSEKTVIASVNSSLPYDLSIKSLNENLTSTEGKAIPVSKLNVKGEGEYINIGTTDNIIYTTQPNTNGEEITHPMNFKLSEMTGYT